MHASIIFSIIPRGPTQGIFIDVIRNHLVFQIRFEDSKDSKYDSKIRNKIPEIRNKIPARIPEIRHYLGQDLGQRFVKIRFIEISCDSIICSYQRVLIIIMK